MRSSFAILALAAGALARPQVTAKIAPSATAPAGCMPTYPGDFTITVVNTTTSSKRSLAQRQLSGTLMLTLAGGILHDMAGRTGYIAANYQFQFDEPPQTGAIYTSGFSVCANNTLALGGSAIFYQCDSGDFFNLYDRGWAAQCSPVYLVAQGGTPASVTSDGQVQGSTAVSLRTDGQPIATTVLSGVVSQITDGQPQVPSAMPLSQLSDGQPQATRSAVTGAPVSQITDGQPQAHSAMPVSQLSDGQPQATASAATGAPVSLMTDGQPIVTSMATKTTLAPVSQISDGQIQATANGTMAYSATPAQFTGAAATPALGFGAMAAGLFGIVAML